MPVPEAGHRWRRPGALWRAICCWLIQCPQPLHEGQTEQSCHSGFTHGRRAWAAEGPLLATGKALKGLGTGLWVWRKGKVSEWPQ